MIAYIKGEVLELEDDSMVVLTGGIGYRVFVPLARMSPVPRIGEEVALHIHMQVKDDGIALFGFIDRKEQELFNMLLGVSGIGAKTALSVLNTCSYNEIIGAVRMGNLQTLNRIPGIGKKSAERILLELKDKVAKMEPTYTAPAQPAVNDMAANVLRTAVLALAQLGYPMGEAQKYVDGVAGEMPADAALEDIITAALKLAASGGMRNGN